MMLISTRSLLVILLAGSCLVIIGVTFSQKNERINSNKYEIDENYYSDIQANSNNMQRDSVLVRMRRAEPEDSTKYGKSTSEPEPKPEMWPEPEPDWENAQQKWQIAWPMHVYGFSCIFLLLGLTSLLELVRIHLRNRRGRRKTVLKVSVLAMLFIFCTTRTIAMLINPYGSNTDLNPIVVRLLFSIGHPCVISAFSLSLLVLIDTTKMNAAPPTFQRVQFVIAIVVFHVILVLLTDILVSFYVQTKVLVLICQIYYLVLGFVFSLGYANVGYKISRNSSAAIARDSNLEKLKSLIIAASITGLSTVILTIYGAAGVFGIYSGLLTVEAWPWWTFQTIGRTLDVAMIILLLLMNIKVGGPRQEIRRFFRRFINPKVQPVEELQANSTIPTNTWMTG